MSVCIFIVVRGLNAWMGLMSWISLSAVALIFHNLHSLLDYCYLATNHKCVCVCVCVCVLCVRGKICLCKVRIQYMTFAQICAPIISWDTSRLVVKNQSAV